MGVRRLLLHQDFPFDGCLGLADDRENPLLLMEKLTFFNQRVRNFIFYQTDLPRRLPFHSPYEKKIAVKFKKHLAWKGWPTLYGQDTLHGPLP